MTLSSHCRCCMHRALHSAVHGGQGSTHPDAGCQVWGLPHLWGSGRGQGERSWPTHPASAQADVPPTSTHISLPGNRIYTTRPHPYTLTLTLTITLTITLMITLILTLALALTHRHSHLYSHSHSEVHSHSHSHSHSHMSCVLPTQCIVHGQGVNINEECVPIDFTMGTQRLPWILYQL